MSAKDWRAERIKAAPMFPLPQVVLYPATDQSLHLFEPRYVQMAEDTLAGSRLIAMANLKPGWEQDYYGAPDIYATVCVGRIALSEKLSNGRYNITLLGLTRASSVAEDRSRLYRLATLEPIADRIDPDQLDETGAMSRGVLRLLERAAAESTLEEMALPDISRGGEKELIVFSYRVAHALKVDLDTKLKLRETETALDRLRMERDILARHLAMTPSGPKQPRLFYGASMN